MNLRKMFGLCEHNYKNIKETDYRTVSEFGSYKTYLFIQKCSKCNKIRKYKIKQ